MAVHASSEFDFYEGCSTETLFKGEWPAAVWKWPYPQTEYILRLAKITAHAQLTRMLTDKPSKSFLTSFSLETQTRCSGFFGGILCKETIRPSTTFPL